MFSRALKVLWVLGVPTVPTGEVDLVSSSEAQTSLPGP